MGHGGPGIQASYTWSKSIDDTSEVIGGTGATGANVAGFFMKAASSIVGRAVPLWTDEEDDGRFVWRAATH